jgi:hypothetical protein
MEIVVVLVIRGLRAAKFVWMDQPSRSQMVVFFFDSFSSTAYIIDTAFTQKNLAMPDSIGNHMLHVAFKLGYSKSASHPSPTASFSGPISYLLSSTIE